MIKSLETRKSGASFKTISKLATVLEIDFAELFALLAGHRRRKALTQSGLAEMAGLSIDMIARLESGNTGARFSTIEKLAQALGIDAAQLFTADIPASSLNNPSSPL